MIVQLEESRNVPDHYKLWFLSESTEDRLLQEFPIIKMWEHSIEDLSKNGKHLLLPFKSIEFRKALKVNKMDEKTTREFAKYNKNIRKTIVYIMLRNSSEFPNRRKNHALRRSKP